MRFKFVIMYVFLLACSAVFGQAAYDASFFHDRAWQEALSSDSFENEWKYAIYNNRSIMVSNPEVYLQADRFWLYNVAMKYGGWGDEFLHRDGNDATYDLIVAQLGESNFGGSGGLKFTWKLFNQHKQKYLVNETNLFGFYDDLQVTGYHRWLDKKMPFIWSSLKNKDWKIDSITLTQMKYYELYEERKNVWMLVDVQGHSYVAEVINRGRSVQVINPRDDSVINNIKDLKICLIMNDTAVWYPLMGRDDRSVDRDLSLVQSWVAEEGSRPMLDVFEASMLGAAVQRTRLETPEDWRWAAVFANRIGKQWAWRVPSILEYMKEIFPERYAEARRVRYGTADIPYELTALNMLITEMGNRLSPLAAHVAASAANKTSDADVFRAISVMYQQWFARPDGSGNVYGQYYTIWLPTFEDKLLSSASDCFVEALNVGAVLTLIGMIRTDWNVYITNWWSLDRRGGHVIAGIYSTSSAYSLSNGTFGRDGTTLFGPFYSYKNKYAYCLYLKPGVGVLTSVQQGNNASYQYKNIFSTVEKHALLDFVKEILTFEKESLFIVGEDRSKKVLSPHDYLGYIESSLLGYSQFKWQKSKK